MSSKEQSGPAKVLQTPSEKDTAAIKLVIYCGVVTFVAGLFFGSLFHTPFAERVAVTSGVVISITVGVFVVAPKAARLASDRFYRGLENPSPRQSKAITNLTMHVLSNASQIAEHDEAKQLYKPIVAACMEVVDESIDKSMANMASQASKGIGAFGDDDGGDTAAMLKEFVGQTVFPTVDGFMESAGASENFRKKVKFKMLSKMAGFKSDGSSSSPDKGGYVPLGGKQEGDRYWRKKDRVQLRNVCRQL